MNIEYSEKYRQIERGVGIMPKKTVVYDPDVAPFFRVPPELSVLDNSADLLLRTTNQFPDMNIGESYIVDGAVIIQDIELLSGQTLSSDRRKQLTDQIRSLNKSSKLTIQVLDGYTLTEQLIYQLQEELDQNPFIVFPGNAGKIVADYFNTVLRDQNGETFRSFQDNPTEFFSSAFLPTKRELTEESVAERFTLDVDYGKLPVVIPNQTILIMDDVVASGQTVETIAEELKTRYPDRKIVCASWLFIVPNAKQSEAKGSAGIKNVDKTYIAAAVKGNYTNRPPVNSASSFLAYSSEQDARFQEYAESYAENPLKFTATKEALRKPNIYVYDQLWKTPEQDAEKYGVVDQKISIRSALGEPKKGIIFTDLDGVWLDEDNRFAEPSSTQTAILIEAINLGYWVVMNSDSGIFTLERYRKQFGITPLVISDRGGSINLPTVSRRRDMTDLSRKFAKIKSDINWYFIRDQREMGFDPRTFRYPDPIGLIQTGLFPEYAGIGQIRIENFGRKSSIGYFAFNIDKEGVLSPDGGTIRDLAIYCRDLVTAEGLERVTRISQYPKLGSLTISDNRVNKASTVAEILNEFPNLPAFMIGNSMSDSMEPISDRVKMGAVGNAGDEFKELVVSRGGIVAPSEFQVADGANYILKKILEKGE